MKTLGTLLLFIVASVGLVWTLCSQHDDDFIRIEPTVARPEPLPTSQPLPAPSKAEDQPSALEQVDPGAVNRAMTLRAFAN